MRDFLEILGCLGLHYVGGIVVRDNPDQPAVFVHHRDRQKIIARDHLADLFLIGVD